MNSNAVIGNTGFSEGVHYWEIICPIFCNSIGKFTQLFAPQVGRLNTRFGLKLRNFRKKYLSQLKGMNKIPPFLIKISP